MKMRGMNCFQKGKRGLLAATILTAAFLSNSIQSYSQDGMAGLEGANSMVRDYFGIGCDLMYAVGGILGLIGAIRVYQK